MLGVLGCVRWAVWGGVRERLLTAAVALFYLVLGYAKSPADSYLLPVLPILALAGADLLRVEFLRADLRRRALPAVVGLGVVCLAVPFASSVRQALLMGAHETREIAAEWIRRNLPPGTRIVGEEYGPRLPIAQGRYAEILAEEERRRPGHGMRTRFEMARRPAGEEFWYYQIPAFGRFRGHAAVEEYDLDRFRREGYCIVILSSALYDRYRGRPVEHPRQNAFFESVSAGGDLLARFDSRTPWCCPQGIKARLSEAAARAWGRLGPTLLIYRLRAC